MVEITVLVNIVESLWLTSFASGNCWLDLCVVASSLWSSLNLILNLLSLLFIRISYLNALTNLLVMRSIQWVHLVIVLMNNHSSFVWWILSVVLVYSWVTYSIAWVSFAVYISITALSGCDSSLVMLQISKILCSVKAGMTLVTCCPNVSWILLNHHLLLNLLFVQLLSWR